MKVGTYYARKADGDDFGNFWSVWQKVETRVGVQVCVVTCGGRGEARWLAACLNTGKDKP
jgi:hypothetical protein